MAKKQDKYKLMTRIVAFILAGLMLIGMASTLLFYIFSK